MERDSKASQGALLSEMGERSFSPHTSLTMDSITSEDVHGLSPRSTNQFKKNQLMSGASVQEDSIVELSPRSKASAGHLSALL